MLESDLHSNMNPAATLDCSGRYVITGSDDRLVKIWSMETSYCLASCRGHDVSLSGPYKVYLSCLPIFSI